MYRKKCWRKKKPHADLYYLPLYEDINETITKQKLLNEIERFHKLNLPCILLKTYVKPS